MEFGSGVFSSFDRYQFSQGLYPRQKLQWRLGLPQWSVKEWRGSLYAQDCKDSDFLSAYAASLDCVEVSSTFYAPVSRERMQAWHKQVRSINPNFHFLPKWPKVITHDRALVGDQGEIKTFLNSLEGLEDSFGVSILQLPPSFSKEYTRELYHFLLKVPEDHPLCLEFRHSSWFENGRVYSKLEDYLAKRKIGMVCSDTPQALSVFHLSFPAKYSVLRYLSDQNEITDQKRLQLWQQLRGQFETQQELGGDFYFVLHRNDNSRAPMLIEYIDEDLASKIATRLASPQRSLFED